MYSKKQQAQIAQRDALDAILSPMRSRHLLKPRGGWIKAIRNALGMRSAQLARRAKLDQTTITRLEQNESKGTITLNSLSRLANALDADLVYAIVPRVSLDDMIRRRAALVLEQDRNAAQKSMALEDQGTQHVETVRDEVRHALLVLSLDRRLWDES